MVARPRFPTVGLPLAVALSLLLASCQDSDPISPDRMGPLLHISDGGNEENSEFFFMPPLAPGPDAFPGDPNPHLKPFVRICETEMNPDGTSPEALKSPAGCVKDVTAAVTGAALGLEMTYAQGAGVYQVNWQTKDLEIDTHYRIEVWGLRFSPDQERQDILDYDHRWLFGWRDITNAPSVASCQQDNTQDFCRINYGQNIPIKAWIGEFVFCPDTGDCSVQFVQSGLDATLTTQLGSLFIPGQEGTDFAIAFEPCSTLENGTVDENGAVDAFIDLPTFGDCMKTVPQPGTGLLPELPATISICSVVEVPSEGPGFFEQLTVHHFSADGGEPGTIGKVEAWPRASDCPPVQHASRNAPAPEGEGVIQLARAFGERVMEWVAPRRLVASGAVALDVGIGGQGFDLRSFWKAAIPARFEYANAGDHAQSGEPGSTVDLEARVIDLVGNPVAGATVRWQVGASPGSGASVKPPVHGITGADGIAQVQVELSDEEGDNVFHAWGRGIANAPDPEDGDAAPLQDCAAVGPIDGSPAILSGLADCNGPRTDVFARGPFDPFMPLFHPHMDDDVNPDGYEIKPVLLAKGVLEFIIEGSGCVPGRGTATVDGQLAPGEWDCAETRTFPVNLSGGSGTATLHWMNDDTHLYMAVEVPGSDRRNSLRIEWHRNYGGPSSPINANGFFTGTRKLGTDVWEFHPGASPEPRDMFIDNQCSGTSATDCGQNDAAYGGQARTTGGFSSQPNTTIYEIAHPLNSPDTCNGQSNGARGCHGYTGLIDLSAAPGDVRGFFLSLRMGSGAQGNTVWPGFLQYLAVEIK